MKQAVTIAISVLGAIIIGTAVGVGAIKLYQQINPVEAVQESQKQTVAAHEFVDPVQAQRSVCQAALPTSESKLYGDLGRRLPGDHRESFTFTGIARVLRTHPVVLSLDTGSVKPDDSPLLDKAVQAVPVYPVTVTDSAVYGLHVGDVIRASIKYSRPSADSSVADATAKESAVAVKLQNALVVTDQEKQGVFATNFALLSVPKAAQLIMANGDVYHYSLSQDTPSGLTDVTKQPRVGDTTKLASQLAKLTLYDSKDQATPDQLPAVYCGYATAADAKLSSHDSQIVQAILESNNGQ